jgi:hypothetical protein
MHGLAAVQKPAPGGLMLLVQVKPALLLQRFRLANDGIETDEFLGFLSRQSDQNPVTERVDCKAIIIIIIGHDGQLNGLAKSVNAISDLT